MKRRRLLCRGGRRWTASRLGWAGLRMMTMMLISLGLKIEANDVGRAGGEGAGGKGLLYARCGRKTRRVSPGSVRVWRLSGWECEVACLALTKSEKL
jgi:hypothetical protein